MTRLLTTLIAFLAVASCATAPKSRVDEVAEEVPKDWSAPASEAPIDHAWIDRFNDKTLESLVDEAIENNFDLKAGAARIERAEAIAKRTGADLQPQVEATVSGARNKQNFIGFPLGGDNTGADSSTVSSSLSNNFGTSVDVTWELDVWGRIRAGVSAALADIQLAQADLRAAQTSLAAQVAKSWFALIEANEQANLAQATVEAFQNTENSIRSRFELGQADDSATAAQLRLAMSDTSGAQADLEARREDVARTTRQLEILLGRYPDGAIKGRRTLPDVPPQPPAGLPSELLMRRPDFVAAERAFAAAGQRTEEARKAFYPRFALTGSVGTQSEDLSEILNSDFGVWSLAGNVLQPIYQGGRLRAERDVRVAEEKESLAQYQETILNGFNEVETALAIENYLIKREAALADSVDSAVEADEQAREEYASGIGDFLTVFAAQNRRLTASSLLITARRLRLDNRINLYLALGGDFRPTRS
ncbi:MAG: TolC family protein [Verrucomicrobiota bacterium]